MEQLSSNRLGMVICMAIGAAAGLLAVSIGDQSPWYVVGLIAVPVAVATLAKHPIALISGIPFLGMFKGQAAREFSVKDPTFIVVACAALVLCRELLLSMTPYRRAYLVERFRHQGAIVTAYFTFIAVAACSLIYSVAPLTGTSKLLRLVIIATILFIAPTILVMSRGQVWTFVGVFVGLSAVLAMRTLLRLIYPDPSTTDITAIDESQAIGAALLAVLFCSWSRDTFGRMRYVLACLLSAGMLAGAARGPVISVLVAALVGLFTTVQKPNRARRLIFATPIVLAIFVGGFFWLQWLSTKNPRFEQKESELSRMLSGDLRTGATGGQRIEMYARAVEAFTERPMLGWGIGGWAVARYGYEYQSGEGKFQTVYPHNIVLETAVEEGMLGLAALFVFLAAIAKSLRRIARIAPEHFGFLVPVCIYCLLVCMFSNDINNRILWAWLGTSVAVGRLVVTPELQAVERSNPRPAPRVANAHVATSQW